MPQTVVFARESDRTLAKRLADALPEGGEVAVRFIVNGPNARRVAHALIDHAPFGAVVKFRDAGRSIDQNDRMWAMLSDVARAKPEGRRHTPDTWKALFMHACGHAVAFEAGLSGEPFPIGFRSSHLTKRQMTELMDFIEAWGTEKGVAWSLPKEDAA